MFMEKNNGNTWGNTYGLLCEGFNQSDIAKKQNLSRKTIWKRTKFYLDTNQIEKVAWGVFRKATKKCNPPPSKPLAIVTHTPIMLPHKFGASFAQIGKPNLPYDKYGKAFEEAPDYYAQFGRYKTQIWLYAGFRGSTPDELIESGRTNLEAIAHSLAVKYNITLTLDRFYSDIEWVDISKERSRITAKEAGMKKKQRIEVAGAIHVLDGVSHNDHLEIDKANGQPEEIPTEHARIRYALYSGEYERRFDMLMLSNERFAKNLELHLEVLREIREAIRRLGK